ncbi:MAG: ABC transporter ATP-binding protein [Spirochaetales bacterium]
MLFEAQHLSKTFGGLTAVRDFSLSINKGELIGLIGPNGAGKTTAFNLMTGIIKPTSGSVRLEGRDITALPAYEVSKLGVARTFQNLRLLKTVSALQNVVTAVQREYSYSFVSALTRTSRFRHQEAAAKAKALEYLDIVGLGQMANSRADSLPYGLQRKLEIARALALSPKVLLLDEPAAGMNPDESLELMNLIESLRKKYDLTILLIEHHMELVMGICERIIVLNFGEILAEGNSEEIQSNEEVIAAYLGPDEEEDEREAIS